MDLAKYRGIFLEEAAEHLEEMSRGLLELERDPERAEALDLVFRMAHSIKGMAATLDLDAISELAHRLEDRMQGLRSAGRAGAGELARLFEGWKALETMLVALRDGADPSPADPELLRGLAAPVARAVDDAAPPPKKASSPR